MNDPVDNPNDDGGMADSGSDASMLDFDLGTETDTPGSQLQTEEEKTTATTAAVEPAKVVKEPVKTGEPAPVSTAQPAKVEQPTLTPESIKSLVSEVFQAAQPKAEVKQPTQEDFDKTFGVVKMTPEMYEQITGVPPTNPNQVVALDNFAQGIVKQAVKMSNHLIQDAFAKADQRIAPIESFRNQVFEMQMEQRFFKSNPDLQPYRDLLVELRGSIEKQGLTFKTEGEAFKFVADKARGILTKLKVPMASTGGANAPAKQPGQRKMTPMAVGGQTSGGNNGSATPSKADEIADLFN